MKKAVYEKPEYKFNDLFLFDGVAEKCWGYKSHTYTISIFRDKDHNDEYTTDEEVLATRTITVTDAGSCDAAYDSLAAQLESIQKEFQQTYDKTFVESPGVKTNAKGTIGDNLFVPIS